MRHISEILQTISMTLSHSGYTADLQVLQTGNHNRDQLWALVNMVINLQVSTNGTEFLKVSA
jgi:hypothetical protein